MFNSKYFYIPLSIIFIFCYPIVSADVLYRDDVARSVYSFSAWGGLGRPLSDFVMHIFSLNFDLLPSAAPLPLFFGIFIASAIIYYICNYLVEKEDSLQISIMLTIIFVSPLFIQNVSFQFDALTMILANSLCMLSFFVFDIRSLPKSLLSIVSLFACLSLYQPCANIFISLIAYNALFGNGKSKSYHLALTFVVTYVLYYVTMFYIMKYGADNRSTMVSFADIPSSLYESINKTFKYIEPIGISFLIPVYIGLLSYFVCYVKKVKHQLSLGFLECSSNLLSPLALLLALPGPAFLLKEGITDIRVLSGASASIAIVIFSIYKLFGKKSFYFISVVMLFITITTSFQFSNAIKEQRKYEEFVMEMVANDLGRLDFNGEVYTYGRIYDSPITWKMIEATPFLKFVYSPAVPWIAVSMMQQLSVKNLAPWIKTVQVNKLNEVCEKKLSPIIKTRYYNVFKIGEDIIVVYGDRVC
ncbi:glucosyltransferase domain-containing protein [Escherichia coli]|uniref:glucosyltransferase domain-containing protein n=1 Tax=Escherichia coli TaxID=562 RepID=UPI003167AD8D